VLVPQPANSTAQRQARHPRMRHDAARRRKAEGLRFPVDVGPRRASLDAGDQTYVIQDDAVHLRKVNHKALITHRVPGHAVAASADRREEPMPAGEPHGVHYVRGAATTRDQRGAAVEHPVEDDARLIVAWLTGAK